MDIIPGVCEECEAALVEAVCRQCDGNWCLGCFHKLHRKGRRAAHAAESVEVQVQTRVDGSIVILNSVDVFKQFYETCFEFMTDMKA